MTTPTRDTRSRVHADADTVRAAAEILAARRRRRTLVGDIMIKSLLDIADRIERDDRRAD